MSVAITQDQPIVQTVSSDRRSRWRKLPKRIECSASLMILVLLLGGGLGWVVRPCPRPARCRRGHPGQRGPGSIQLGVQALAQWHSDFDPTGQRAPQWLLDYLGHDYFGHVEQVELGPRGVDAVFKQLGQLDQVRRLSFFNGIDLGPLAIASLKSLPNSSMSRFQSLLGLFTADITPPEFKGANFQYVQNRTRLKDIDFPANISVTDADLAYLGRLTALTRLPLHDPRHHDAGLASLKDMTKLKILRLAFPGQRGWTEEPSR